VGWHFIFLRAIRFRRGLLSIFFDSACFSEVLSVFVSSKILGG